MRLLWRAINSLGPKWCPGSSHRRNIPALPRLFQKRDWGICNFSSMFASGSPEVRVITLSLLVTILGLILHGFCGVAVHIVLMMCRCCNLRACSCQLVFPHIPCFPAEYRTAAEINTAFISDVGGFSFVTEHRCC